MESYRGSLRVNLETMSRSIHMIGIDLAVDQMQQTTILSYSNSFLTKTIHSPRKVPEWNKKLSGLRVITSGKGQRRRF